MKLFFAASSWIVLKKSGRNNANVLSNKKGVYKAFTIKK